MEKCSWCRIMQSLRNLYFKNDNEKYRIDYKRCMSSNHKKWYCNIHDKVKNYKRADREKK